jgi:hypothetical protein
MRRTLAVAAALAAALAATNVPVAAQDTSPQPPSTAIVRSITITGNKELPNADLIRAGRLHLREPLPDDVDRVASRIERHYRNVGYSFARVTGAWDATSGAVTFTVEEGIVEKVEFHGIDPKLAEEFASDFAIRAGDVFNKPKAMHALDALLKPTRGAIRKTDETFDLVDRAGERVLLVDLREPAGRFRLLPDMGAREDWFTPVDGLVPSVGFGAAVFNHESFNHAFVTGHFSVRAASGSVGYALGFERPFFSRTKLFVGGEVRDLTASDDRWQVSSTEASLAAIGPRLSFRDYYRQKGVQLNAALRVHPHAELIAAYRYERQEPLHVETDFSLWNSDDPIRPNRPATDGHLSAFVVGATFNGTPFDEESLEGTYRRHQLDTLFGQRLPGVEDHDMTPLWRLDWTTEISAPDALRSDFDFTRTILAARAELPMSRHQTFSARGVAGWSTGVLPPQRQFGLGGIGSVHGYEFKEEIGDSMTLANLEYALGNRTGLRVIGFYDVGRATFRASPTDPDWMNGVGFGIGMGDLRLDFGYKLHDIPSSFQFLMRFVRTF